MSVYPNTGCHAVLALLSEGYPPLEGRSPTRYSPVCHSTDPLRDFRVRLACVRHAASVDSEPGSNSQVKFVGPVALPFGSPLGHNSLTQAPLNWLSDSSHLRSRIRSSSGGPFKSWMVPRRSSSPKFGAQAGHPLILDGLCLHVLSSFQRTERPRYAHVTGAWGTLQTYDET